MFALTQDAPEAADLFAHAAALLGGRYPRDVVLESADAGLHQNRIGQILCTLQSLAAAASLRDAFPRERIIAGYSVGEVASWGVADLVEAKVTLDLVARRADVMDAAIGAGQGLLFIRGLSRKAIDALCRSHDTAVAIVNPGNAYVIGGADAALDALAEDAKRMNAARVVRVAVDIASHIPRLAAAAVEFRNVLQHIPVKPTPMMGVRLLSGVDGTPVLDISTGLDKLAAQISHTVEWAACLAACVEAGATAFLELGPGRALAEMAAMAYPEIHSRSLDDFRTREGARNWLQSRLD